MREKLKAHHQKHKTVYRLCLTVFVFVMAGMILNFRSALNTSQNITTRKLERQALAELDIYHNGSIKIASENFRHSLDIINNLSLDPQIISGLKPDNVSALSRYLEEQRDVNDHFSSLAVSDKSKVIAISSDSASAQSLVGRSIVDLPSAKTLVTKDKLSINPAVTSGIGRSVLSIGAPIGGTSSSPNGYVFGAVTLKALSDEINLTSSYTNFGSVLTDNEGNLLINNNQPLSSIENISQSEPLFKKIVNSPTNVNDQEYNFENKNVFAEGSKLDFGSAGSLYIISYYYKDGFAAQLKANRADVSSMFSGFAIRNVCLLAAMFALIIYIIKKHDTN